MPKNRKRGVTPDPRRVLGEFCDDIDAAGGLQPGSNGRCVPVGDPAWGDLAETYLKACRALGREPLIPELAEEEPLLLIQYRCPDCGHEWQDEHTSACDADCPECEARDITALSWEELPTED